MDMIDAQEAFDIVDKLLKRVFVELECESIIRKAPSTQSKITNEDVNSAIIEIGAYFSIKALNKEEGDTPIELLRLVDKIRKYFEALSSAEPKKCDGCKWEDAYGYGECYRCSRAYEDLYEVNESEL